MIKEVAAIDYAEGVRLSLEADMVIVRGLINIQLAKELAEHSPPKPGKIRAYTHPLARKPFRHAIPVIEDSKQQVDQTLRRKLGRFATLNGVYLQQADQIRRGCVPTHIDDTTILISTSVNFDNAEAITTFYAARIAEADAPYAYIRREFISLGDNTDNLEAVTLNEGDAVIISRGVAHGSTGSERRSSATYRTRGLVL